MRQLEVGVGEGPIDGREQSGRDHDSVRSSRTRFLTQVVAGVGAAASGMAVVGSRATSASSAFTAAQDVRILNFLLLLEHAQERFYAAAESAGALSGELATFAQVVGGHEREHLDALRTELGGAARPAPTVEPGDAVRNERAFIVATVALEEAVAAAFIGQAANLTVKRIPPVARIVAVEARHAAWIRDIAGRLPAPSAADPPRTAARAMNALRKAGIVIRS